MKKTVGQLVEMFCGIEMEYDLYFNATWLIDYDECFVWSKAEFIENFEEWLDEIPKKVQIDLEKNICIFILE